MTGRTCYLIRQEIQKDALQLLWSAFLFFKRHAVQLCDTICGDIRHISLVYYRLTVVGEADFKAAHEGEGCEVGQAAQTKQYSTHGVELTGELSKQPPVNTEKRET